MARILACVLAALALGGELCAGTIRELVRFESSDGTPPILQGFGLVVGLSGTGDSGKELAVARPLAEALRARGFPVTAQDLERGRSVALVSVTCRIEAGHARRGDRFDATVAVVHSATSLRGGQLFLAPLAGPRPGDDVFAVAEGSIALDDRSVLTRGRVAGGAYMVRDFLTGPRVGAGASFDLVLRPHFAGHQAATVIAREIDQMYFLQVKDGESSIARAVDDRTIRITIPQTESHDVVGFVGQILSFPIRDLSRLGLPARVIVDRASQTIVLTAEVQISPVVIDNAEMTITTILPPIEPTPENPQLRQTTVAPVQVGEARASQRARLQDLIAAMDQLSVPFDRKIRMLELLRDTGQLHAELIVN